MDFHIHTSYFFANRGRRASIGTNDLVDQKLPERRGLNLHPCPSIAINDLVDQKPHKNEHFSQNPLNFQT